MILQRTLVLSLLACLLALPACDRSSAQSGASQQAATEIRLGYFANVTHAQAVLGVHNGDYSKAVAPAKLSTKVFNAGPSLIEALFAGEIDVGYVGPGPAISAHAKSRGSAIKVIAGAAANGVLIVARKDANISSLAELKGKTIATPQHGNTQDIAARHYVLSELKQPDDKNILPVTNAEQAALMARGQIDAAWAPEPWGSRLIMENGAKLLAEEKDFWPDKQFNLTLVVTTPEFLKAHPDVIEKLLAAHVKLTAQLNSGASSLAPQLDEAIGKLTGKRLPAGVIDSSLKYVKFTDEPLEQTLAAMGAWAHDLRMLPNKPELGGLVDLSVLRKIKPEVDRVGG
jgi:NitT/TauT family transport system substrate-binding protein